MYSGCDWWRFTSHEDTSRGKYAQVRILRNAVCVLSLLDWLIDFTCPQPLLSPWLCHSLHLPSATRLVNVSCRTPVSLSCTCSPPPLYILCHSFPCLLLDCCLLPVVLCCMLLLWILPVSTLPGCPDRRSSACPVWTVLFFFVTLFGLSKVFFCVNLHRVLDSSAHELLQLATCDVRRDRNKVQVED